ncbi:MAG: GTP-binding protein [Thermoplasmata archaeon]|nr:MAG: GTP-binding protein [Thermoplasmata archaeon]
MDSEAEIKKKVILLGDGAVGKTSLIRRFVVDKFDDKYLVTVGFKITSRNIQITRDANTHYLKLNIWDILGQKGYLELHKSSLPGTSGVLLVVDITRKDTLESLESYWIPNVINIVGQVPFVVLANKWDLKEDAQFGEKELKRFKDKYKAPFFFTSAKSGENVKRGFYAIGKRMIGFRDSVPIKQVKIREVEGEINAFSQLIDRIISDFSKEFGRPDDAMPILRKQFEASGLDLNDPSVDAIIVAIKRLALIEKGFKKREEVEANLNKRLRWIKEMEQAWRKP